MEHYVICKTKEEFVYLVDFNKMKTSKKACFAKGDFLNIVYNHMLACFEVISVLDDCIDDDMVHLCLVPVLVESEVENSVAYSKY